LRHIIYIRQLWGCALILLFGLNTGVGAQTNPPAWQQKLTSPNLILDPLQHGQERVAVIVTLVPNARAKQRTDWNAAQSVQTLRTANRAASTDVLKDVAANERRVRHEFDNHAGFSCELTPKALEKLASDPRVASIEPVVELQMHLNQGIPLMNALASRSTYNGTNMAIAICDTGIDYTHPRLGGGGFPNSKVIGGYDYGNNDANPMPVGEAHGTACAGIAAGDLGTVGDYIGGVAPGAKLYALKISADGSGSANNDSMVAAWDWCVTHKNDDPNNPIMVISTSFGGGRYFSSCDSYWPSMTAAANNAVAAGITVLASSGNDGYCDSMGWPACISSVISVGAMYDAAVGTLGFCVNSASCATKSANGGCTTGYAAFDNTATNKVTSYSNTANFLDIFAPANQCYTLDIVGATGSSSGDYYSGFGGTSAACPYAAGAVAALQHAAKALTGSYLTPAEVRARLAVSGTPTTDPKVAITKPRVNLGNTITNLYTILTFTNATATDALGNANGFLDPGETIQETIVWKNIGAGMASNLTVTILPPPAGVTLLQPVAAYSNAPIGGTTTNATPFVYRLAKDIPCGTTVLFSNVLTTGSGHAFTGTFSRLVGQLQISGTVTNTFDSTNVPKSILDVATIYSTNIIATTGSIDDVNVTVRLDHTYDADLVVALQHPDGTEVVLAANRGSSGDDFGSGTCGAGETRTTFDDEAATAISAGGAPFLSSYRPEGLLANLVDKPVNGTWRLRVTDGFSLDTGTLSCWGVRIISHSTSYLCSTFNNSPIASNLTFAIHHGASTNLTLHGSDPDDEAITYQTNSLPANGTLSSFNSATGSITYTATAGYNGADTFTFITNDGLSNSLAGTVSITVTGTVLTPPQLLVTPANHDFGYVITGTTVQTSFTVTNLGQSLLTGTVNTGDAFNVAGNTATQMLVNITPVSAGAFTSNIIFTSNGGVSTNPLSGTGAIVPIASFTGTPTSGPVPLIVDFTDTSTGTITDRLWDFGDGITSNTSLTSIQHTYGSAAIRTVRLIATGPVGVSTNTQNDYITALTAAQLLVTPASHDFGYVITGTTVQTSFTVTNLGQSLLTGTVNSGGAFTVTGNSATQMLVSITPTSAGAFSSNIVFTSNGGISTNPVTGGGAIVPVTTFTGTPTNGPIPLVVDFTDTSSGTITNRAWDFGDGTTTNTTLTSIQHTYTTAAIRTVRLITTGPVGVNTNTQADYITALTPAQILVTPVSHDFGYIATGVTVQTSFTVTNLGEALLTGTVNVGGTFDVTGNTSTQLTISVTTATEGPFTNDIVFTSNGSMSTNPATGIGAIAPLALFTATPTNGLAPLAVDFTDLSTGTITNRYWDFGDSTFTNLLTNAVAHVYNTASTNAVTLIVTGPLGVSTSTVVTVIATNIIPTADLALTQTASANPVTLGDALTFSLIISNFGGASATSVTITDTLPASVTFITASPGCVTNGTLLICDLGTLASNAATTVSFTVVPALPGKLTNAAIVSAVEPDPNLADNSFTLEVTVPVDADGDGIPDALELLHGLDPHDITDATRDDDGDGFTNLQEYHTGTDPHDAVSAFRITSVTPINNDVLITWRAGAGTTNVVQRTSILTNGFFDISAPYAIPAGTEILTNHLDVGGATNPASQFYRIRLQP